MVILNKAQSKLVKFHKYEKDDKIWWVAKTDNYGEMLFTFDKITVFNFFQDYPQGLSEEQIRIFKEENPELARLK